MNSESPNHPREDMEARLTAFLLGELSADEAAAVRQAITQDAELARLHERLKSTIDLVREAAVSPDMPAVAQHTSLKLSEARRQKLLQRFKTVAPKEFTAPQRHDLSWLLPMSIAAVLVALLGSAVLLPSLARSQKTPKAVTMIPGRFQRDLAELPDSKMAADSADKSGRVQVDRARRNDLAQQKSAELETLGRQSGVHTFAPPPIVKNADVAGSPRSQMETAPSPTALPAAKARNSIVLPTAEFSENAPVASVPKGALAKSGPGSVSGVTGGLGGGGIGRGGLGGGGFGGGVTAQAGVVADAEKQLTAASTPPVGSKILLGVESAGKTIVVTASDFAAANPASNLPTLAYNKGPALQVADQVERLSENNITLKTDINSAPAFGEVPALGTSFRGTDNKDKIAPSQIEYGAIALPLQTTPQTATDNFFAAGAMGPGTAGGDGKIGVQGVTALSVSPVAEIPARNPFGLAPPPVDSPQQNLEQQRESDIVAFSVNGAAFGDGVTLLQNESASKVEANKNTELLFENRSEGLDQNFKRQLARINSYAANGEKPAADSRNLTQDQLAPQAQSVAGNTLGVPLTAQLPPPASPLQSEERAGERRDKENAVNAPFTDPLLAARGEGAGKRLFAGSVESKAGPAGPAQAQTLPSTETTAPKEPAPNDDSRGYMFKMDPKLLERYFGVRPGESRPSEDGAKKSRKLDAQVRVENTEADGDAKAVEDILGDMINPYAPSAANAVAERAAAGSSRQFDIKAQPQAPTITSIPNQTTPSNQPFDLKAQAQAAPERLRGDAASKGARLLSAAQTNKLTDALETAKRKPEQKISQLMIEDRSASRPAPPAPVPQPELPARDNAFSTFSLNVSDVSFRLAAASLEKGVMPELATVRSEEFINAFDYRDSEPPPGAPLAFAWERARYPFGHNRDLLRFSVKTAAQGRQAGRPLNIVLLLDNSGSMERADRVQTIREALRVLASELQPQDKLSVVAFARTARLWADGVPGNQAGQVAEQVSNLTPQGGTNLEDAMNLGYQTARKHYIAGGVNRLVLLTDGAANLGNVDPEALKQKVEAHRQQGIALDCFGIGWEGFNDDLLEVLSRNGDGRYGFVNTPEEATTEFAGKLAGALRVAASDVKVQVEFNPKRVTAYRQIGYAKHQLTKQQFRDNTVDAAEIGAAESGNALYVVEVNPRGEGLLAVVRVRYKAPDTGFYYEHEWAVPYAGNAAALEQASPALRLAATASAFSEWLVSSPYAAEVTPDRLLAYLSGVPEVFGIDPRPKKLEWMIRQAKSIAGK